ncbi:MAG: PIN domain-containing protein [Phycisphaerae bacterium]|nr:PIN domain-containing protein [Phycisphaerae bacterium]MDW8262182.1 PIN domain-containing protein [Phycisphaerales bacterium]
MVLTVLRALFVLLMAAVGWTFVLDPGEPLGQYTWLSIAIALSLAVFIICTDILAPRRKLLVFSSVFTGLVVGVLAAYALSFVVTLLVHYVVSYINSVSNVAVTDAQRAATIQFVNLLVGTACCYYAISFVLQTGDDFRFIVPYVEFSKQTKGARPILLDTNVLIDGRIADLVETGILETELLVPQFVVKELRTLADSNDRSKRNRGKHGQEVLQRLSNNSRVPCRIYDTRAREDQSVADVDDRLIALALQLNAKIMTTDVPLAQEARVKGVDVINLNELATRLKTHALPGDHLTVQISKPGELPEQGVGYLEDGTMVVVEDGKARLHEEVEITVTNVRQNPNGKMIFGRIGDRRPAAASRRDKSSSRSAT